MNKFYLCRTIDDRKGGFLMFSEKIEMLLPYLEKKQFNTIIEIIRYSQAQNIKLLYIIPKLNILKRYRMKKINTILWKCGLLIPEEMIESIQPEEIKFIGL